MINRVVLVGRLTKDPELRYTPSGVAVCRFTLAVNRQFSNQQGERQADFVNILTWRKQAENVANYLHKGSLAGLEGRIQTGSYVGQDDKKVFTVEVVADSVQFLEPKSQHGNQNGSPQQQPPQNYQTQQNSNGQQNPNGQQDPFVPNTGAVNISDDDLPF